MVLYAIFSSFAQVGIKPHRSRSIVRSPVSGLRRIVRTLGWRDVGTDWKIELRRDWDMILASDFFFGYFVDTVRTLKTTAKATPLSQVSC